MNYLFVKNITYPIRILNMPTITLYVAILGLMLLWLTVCVIKLRWQNRVALGDGGHPALQSAIRAHGNFTEVVPFVLILMVILAMNSASIYLLHAMGLVLVIGRGIHAHSLLHQKLSLRPVGMGLGTFTPVLLGVAGCLYYALRSL
jgi:uncharacterized protein